MKPEEPYMFIVPVPRRPSHSHFASVTIMTVIERKQCKDPIMKRIDPEHLAKMPHNLTLRLSPEGKMIAVVTRDDQPIRHFDTADQAVAWANDTEAVKAWRQEMAAQDAQYRVRSGPGNGWSVRYRRATDTWEASRGGQVESFETEAEALAFTYEG